MNVQSNPAEQPQKAARAPRRKPPKHRVPAAVEQRESKPFFMNWGAELNHRERESIKEQIALVAGLVLVAVLAIIIGWGWYQDNIAAPAARAAANNQEIAQVGSQIIRVGPFKQFEQFEQTSINSRLQTYQQQALALQANPKKNATQLAQYQAAESQLQQQLTGLPQGTLSDLIDRYTILQSSGKAGVPLTAKVKDTAWRQFEKQANGPQHAQAFVSQSGLSMADFRVLIYTDYLRGKLSTKLAAGLSRHQLETRASHILIVKTNKSLAEKVLKQARGGASFTALARKYSTDTTSAKKGGDLGYFKHGDMVAPFDLAAFSMKVGQIRLVKSQFGWHIIKVTGRKQVTLSAKQYQQTQSNALSVWLQKQQAKLAVRRLMAPPALPGAAPALANGLPGQGISPQQLQRAQSQLAPQPAHSNNSAGKTAPKVSSGSGKKK